MRSYRPKAGGAPFIFESELQLEDILERLDTSATYLNSASQPSGAQVARDAQAEIRRLRQALQKISRYQLHHPKASMDVRETARIAIEALAAQTSG